ncbi:glycosyltransferase family 4 protein [Candidatus Woesebacteria bacterium]|nr:MAG: glycosyltransferase family 4 protein [Candidatus Woesebacteria bacterium]
MKILIDGRMYGLENTGIGRYVINLVNNIKTLDNKNTYYILLKTRYFNELNLPNNWKKIETNINHYSLKEQVMLPKIIKQIKPTLVHFPHINVPVLYKGKYVVTVHDMTQLSFDNKATTLPMPLYIIKHLALKIVFSKVKRADALITPSNFVKDALILKNISPNKIYTTYEGVDRNFYADTNITSLLHKNNILSKYFVYAGNAYPHKNIESAINALRVINTKRKEKIKLVIISPKGKFSQKLKQYVINNHIDNEVVILGFVSDGEYAAILHHAIAFVFPSLSEGFGLPGLEAMSLGTPLLCSNIPVFKEIYGENAIYFRPKDLASLSDAMNYIIKLDKEKRQLLTRNAKRHAQNYSWKNMASETLEIYHNIN